MQKFKLLGEVQYGSLRTTTIYKIMGRLFDKNTYLQNEKDPEMDAVYIPYRKETCKDCKYCEYRKIDKFKSVFYCTNKNKFISPNSVKECIEYK